MTARFGTRSGSCDAAIQVASVSQAVALPEEEQLLLGCTAAGAVLGLILGRLVRQVYMGGIAGAVAAVAWSNRDTRLGAFVRTCGKLAVIGAYRAVALQQELTLRWKAWRVYERVYKEFEKLERRYEVSNRVADIDNKYAISNTVSSWWSLAAGGAVDVERVVATKLSPSLEGLGRQLDSIGVTMNDAFDDTLVGIERQYNAATLALTEVAQDVTQALGSSWQGVNFRLEVPNMEWKSSGTGAAASRNAKRSVATASAAAAATVAATSAAVTAAGTAAAATAAAAAAAGAPGAAASAAEGIAGGFGVTAVGEAAAPGDGGGCCLDGGMTGRSHGQLTATAVAAAAAAGLDPAVPAVAAAPEAEEEAVAVAAAARGGSATAANAATAATVAAAASPGAGSAAPDLAGGDGAESWVGFDGVRRGLV
ncbi:unnamed protein product [Phaeothamnion confervicola]